MAQITGLGGPYKKPLRSLEEWNAIRRGIHDLAQRPQPNGIACPNCGAELHDVSPDEVLTSFPPQKHVGCPGCGWKGKRVE